MRHVSIAAFKDKISEVAAAAMAGEDITITKHGRDLVRLVLVDHDRAARKREAVDALYAIGQQIREKHGPTTPEEIGLWIDEGRR